MSILPTARESGGEPRALETDTDARVLLPALRVRKGEADTYAVLTCVSGIDGKSKYLESASVTS